MARISWLRSVQHFQQQLRAAEVSLGPAALERKFGHYLFPSFPFLTDQLVVGNQYVVEGDFIEFMIAGLSDHGANGQSRAGHVHQELRHARMPVVRLVACAHDGNHAVRLVRTGGPDLASIDDPSAIRKDRACTDRGKVRAGIGFAHSNAEEHFSARNLRHDARREGFFSEAHQQRGALSFGNPVCRDRRASRQQFLQDDVALQHAALLASEAARPGHPEPAFGGKLATEAGVPAGPAARALRHGHVVQVVRKKLAHLGAQDLAFGREGSRADIQ